MVSKTELMSEAEWRAIGVQMSPGWIHYMIHRPGMLLFLKITESKKDYLHLRK